MFCFVLWQTQFFLTIGLRSLFGLLVSLPYSQNAGKLLSNDERVSVLFLYMFTFVLFRYLKNTIKVPENTIKELTK